MRKVLAFVLLSSVIVNGWSQTTQPCVVTQYNQKQPKTPLAGVEVMASNAGSTVSGADGRLTLSFRTLKPGDKVRLISAKKAGYELFNSEAVEQWNISRNSTPFSLVLVKSEYFSHLKGKLTQSSTDSYQSKYQQAVRELERQKKAGKLKEEEYNRKYDDLEAKYQEQLTNLDNYIDQFARIDLSEVSEEEQRILDMVQEGRIDDAVKAYETLDIGGKLRQARANKKALSEARAKIEDEEKRQDLAIDNLMARQDREIATLKLAGGRDNYDKVGHMLKDNALADTTDYNAALNYADFAEKQIDFSEAERFYQLCIRHCPDEYLSRVLIWVGNFYNRIKRYAEAESSFLAAIKAAQERCDIGLEDVAKNNLGLLYYKTSRFDQAESYYLESLDLRTRQFEQDQSTENRYQLAVTQSNLAFLYISKADSAKADYFLFSALRNFESLCSYDSLKYRDDLADMQIRIAKYYLHGCRAYHLGFYLPREDSLRVSKAESCYYSALENYRLLYSQKPAVYWNGLSNCLSYLGDLNRFVMNPSRALAMYQESMDIDLQHYKNNPERYQLAMASSYNNMGIMCEEMGDTVKAEKYYLDAYNIYVKQYGKYPDTFLKSMKAICKNLCNLYRKKGETAKYEEFLKQMVELFDMAIQNNHSDRSDAVSWRGKLARLYLQTGRMEEAKAIFVQIHGIDSLESVNYNLAKCYEEMGEKAAVSKDFENAKEYYTTSIAYYRSYRIESGKDEIYEKTGELYHQLAMNSLEEKDTIHAEEYYLQALENYALLYRQRLESRGSLARFQQRIGVFYEDAHNDARAEEYYLRSLENYKALFAEKPQEYRLRLAWLHYCLMNLYGKNSARDEQYEAMLDSALAHYELLFQEDSAYKSRFVDLLNRKGIQYCRRGQFHEALKMWKKVLALDPEFLSKHNGSTELYQQLKERQLIK